jgi:hypothetical protein
MAVEWHAHGLRGRPYPFALQPGREPSILIRWEPIVQGIVDDLRDGTSTADVAARFHAGLRVSSRRIGRPSWKPAHRAAELDDNDPCPQLELGYMRCGSSRSSAAARARDRAHRRRVRQRGHPVRHQRRSRRGLLLQSEPAPHVPQCVRRDAGQPAEPVWRRHGRPDQEGPGVLLRRIRAELPARALRGEVPGIRRRASSCRNR